MTAVAAAVSDGSTGSGLTDGYQAAFIGAAVIAAAAAVVAAALVRRPSSARALSDPEVLEPDLAA
jgi:hypothetical protein